MQLGALLPRVPELVLTIDLARNTRFSAWRVEQFRVTSLGVRGVGGVLAVVPR